MQPLDLSNFFGEALAIGISFDLLLSRAERLPLQSLGDEARYRVREDSGHAGHRDTPAKAHAFLLGIPNTYPRDHFTQFDCWTYVGREVGGYLRRRAEDHESQDDHQKEKQQRVNAPFAGLRRGEGKPASAFSFPGTAACALRGTGVSAFPQSLSTRSMRPSCIDAVPASVTARLCRGGRTPTDLWCD
jgi:hypothetical protein